MADLAMLVPPCGRHPLGGLSQQNPAYL